jgi:hypothetical protein
MTRLTHFTVLAIAVLVLVVAFAPKPVPRVGAERPSRLRNAASAGSSSTRTAGRSTCRRTTNDA